MKNSRGGPIELLVVAVGLAVALVVTWIVVGNDSDLTGSRLNGLFVVAMIVTPFFSALIGYKVAGMVRAPGRPLVWAVLCWFLPFIGIALTLTLGIALRRVHFRQPSTS